MFNERLDALETQNTTIHSMVTNLVAGIGSIQVRLPQLQAEVNALKYQIVTTQQVEELREIAERWL
jgi:peptidoglycan hydrolase CwlO-like protein